MLSRKKRRIPCVRNQMVTIFVCSQGARKRASERKKNHVSIRRFWRSINEFYIEQLTSANANDTEKKHRFKHIVHLINTKQNAPAPIKTSHRLYRENAVEWIKKNLIFYRSQFACCAMTGLLVKISVDDGIANKWILNLMIQFDCAH